MQMVIMLVGEYRHAKLSSLSDVFQKTCPYLHPQNRDTSILPS